MPLPSGALACCFARLLIARVLPLYQYVFRLQALSFCVPSFLDTPWERKYNQVHTSWGE